MFLSSRVNDKVSILKWATSILDSSVKPSDDTESCNACILFLCLDSVWTFRPSKQSFEVLKEVSQ